jgi:type IV secretory pathway TraG/TraD family ATPase VirD4
MVATSKTENRKSNNPVVIGIQGKAQMETLYGHLAEAMLSQPWTKIFLKTSEPRAAKWISDAIGEEDREWLRESRTSGAVFTASANRETKTYAVDKRTIPLILPAEVSGLPALTGFLKNRNDVVRMSFPYIDFPKIADGFMRRDEPPRQPAAAPAAKPEAGKTHKLEQQHEQERGAVRTFFD